MLKLALKNGEVIQFGKDVTIRFDKATNNRIELVIDAPREVQIHRKDAKRGRRWKNVEDSTPL